MDESVNNEEGNEIHTTIEYDIDECSCLLDDEEEPPLPPSPKDEQITENILLEPDHPLLAKFQAQLKEQLLKQIQGLKEEIFELEVDAKKKSNERDDLGVAVYDAQQIVSVQYDSVENFETEIQNIIAERIEIEKEVENITKEHKEIHDKLSETEKKEKELCQEIDIMNFMYRNMMEWENKLESELAVQQRITDKSKYDKKKIAEEKRNLDFLIYKLMTEVFRLENNLDNYDMQLRVKEQEREKLGTMIANANTDIESLEKEHKRLMHSWNSVLVAIGYRDKLYDTAKKDLEKQQEHLLNVITEIAVMKKQSAAEMAKNEQLTLIKGRIDMEKTSLNTKITRENDKIAQIEKKLFDNQQILNQTNKDLQEILSIKKLTHQDLDEIRSAIDKNVNIKTQIEERILAILQEQISNDKISRYMNKTIRNLRESNRSIEIQLAIVENKNADLVVEVEKQKVLNEETLHHFEDIQKREKDQENELNEKNCELKYLTQEIKKNLLKFDEASKKYEETLRKTGGVELSPTEVKVKRLEKSIQEFDEKNAKLKSFWLTQQRYIVSMREERQKQLYEINIIRKQTMLLQQQNFKVDDELDELDRQQKIFEKNIKKMTSKIEKLNAELSNKKGQKNYLDAFNYSYKQDAFLKLKEAELDCIKLEDHLLELEEEKHNLCKDLIDFNREALAWEKKVKLAQETKQTIVKERSSEGEVGSMKAEIHRMEVRYSQLRKAQDKLGQDLHHCLSRREFIVINSLALEKRLCVDGKVQNKAHIKRKLEDTKNKLQKFEHDKDKLEERLNRAYELENDLFEKITENDLILDQMRNNYINLVNNIDQAQFDRQKELQILVFKQHKLRAFTSISKGQYRCQYRLQVSLDKEYQNERSKNRELQAFLEYLSKEFPNFNVQFAKILNTLLVVPKFYYST